MSPVIGFLIFPQSLLPGLAQKTTENTMEN